MENLLNRDFEAQKTLPETDRERIALSLPATGSGIRGTPGVLGFCPPNPGRGP